MTAPAPLAVGDFVYTSWGYDQTNVTFYRVVGLTPSGKSARLQQVWARDVATDDNPHRALVPTEHPAEDRSGKPVAVITHRILDDHGTVKPDGQHAWKWDGKPKYATGHGYGH